MPIQALNYTVATVTLGIFFCRRPLCALSQRFAYRLSTQKCHLSLAPTT